METGSCTEARRKTLKGVLRTLKKIDTKIFTHKGKWDKGSYCTNKNGDSLPLSKLHDREAYSFCLIGAHDRAVGIDGRPNIQAVINFAEALGFGSSSDVINYNDAKGRSFKQIKNRIANGIKRVEKELAAL